MQLKFRTIFDDKYYGVAAGIKLNRQQVLVALQKDLNLINQSQNGVMHQLISPLYPIRI